MEQASTDRGLYLRRLVGTWVSHKPTARQETALRLVSQREILFGGSAGGGKALALDTPIPTPDGWAQMADLKRGDWVIGDDGKPCRVLAAFPILLNERCYRVSFDDGTSIVASGDHRWVTWNYSERSSATRKAESRKARRRAERPRRGTGKRPDLSLRNQITAKSTPASGSVRTTEEIASTLTGGKSIGHAIVGNVATDLPWQPLEIDPYVLGAWLGDGTSANGGFTCNDPEILREIESAGFSITKWNGPYGYGIDGLSPLLKSIGVRRNKHIPTHYLRASRSDRIALLQGLMDTDGYAAEDGHCELALTNAKLARDSLELIRSLGIKVRERTKIVPIRGGTLGYCYRYKFRTSLPVFRLSRKRIRQKTPRETGRTRYRYITSVERVESVPVRCIAVDNESQQYLAGEGWTPTHNTDWLLMEALRFVHVPGYSALLLRRTFPELNQPGGLIPRSLEWLAGTPASYSVQRSEWTFPSGATLTFGHMQREFDKLQYQGGAFAFVGFDELTHFTESQYRYLFSRVRRPKDPADELSGIPLRMRAASNPGGPGHDWVRQRFLIESAPSRSFIPARLSDNPYLDAESYIQGLMELSSHERQQLLDGDWDARPPGALFKREWFAVVKARPVHVARRVRSWDLAATQQKAGTDPDWTVGTLISSTADKHCTVEHVTRGRWSPAELDRVLLSTAQQDPQGTEIWIEEEPGSSGKIASAHFRKLLAGYTVHFERPTGHKTTRAMPWASYAENGGVSIVEAPWNREWLDEHERFDPDPTMRGHDDQVDSADLGFAKLHLGRSGWELLYPQKQEEESASA